MTKISYYFFIIIIISTLSNGCIDNNEDSNIYNKKSLPAGLYTFNISFIASDNNNFSLYVPLPIQSNGLIHNSLDNLQIIQGNISIQYINTHYGKALNISGNDSFIVHALYNGSTMVELSMGVKNYSINDAGDRWYWFYYNSENKSERSFIYLNSNSNNWIANNYGEKIKASTSFNTRIEGYVIHGWQRVHGYQMNIIID